MVVYWHTQEHVMSPLPLPFLPPLLFLQTNIHKWVSVPGAILSGKIMVMRSAGNTCSPRETYDTGRIKSQTHGSMFDKMLEHPVFQQH